MQKPMIHLNGDTAETLADLNFDALQRVTDAMEAIMKATPNARNFYPIGPDAYPTARAEHVARLESLAKVAADLSAIAEHCVDHIRNKTA